MQLVQGVSVVDRAGGAGWCRVVQSSAEWCRAVQGGAEQCRVVQGGVGWCRATHATKWGTHAGVNITLK